MSGGFHLWLDVYMLSAVLSSCDRLICYMSSAGLNVLHVDLYMLSADF